MSRPLNDQVSDWHATLVRLGIPEIALTGRHTFCPACGGEDRFRFDNQHGRGRFYCNQCGPGDGFDLLQRVHGWRFKEAKAAVFMPGTNLGPALPPSVSTNGSSRGRSVAADFRINELLRTSSPIECVRDVVRYLASRHLLPLPSGLLAHPNVEYWDEGKSVGRFPSLLAPVLDVYGERVSLHVTYLNDGRKLQDYEPRKLLGPLKGRRGCAVRLGEPTHVLGIAEGIETALACWHLHGISTWAALSAGFMAKFEPPSHVEKLIIFGDRDSAGLAAASHLRTRMQISCELCVPSVGDWADVLAEADKPEGGMQP